ncbi:auxilin-like clathrin-binding protein required for normal clathrin function [Malassezia yamatoensis]|uniref:Auxilin-like clathrin-binding protein required for normal clathrin function n=1 Tax=Malassezia yamatoensis TaxID=253288 RepID=A0AAJ5YT90_9BASI|nr:auxilin-like clathrin-binding protein required for normal clathrin function [Malassezia yamatoensis]
MDELASLDFNGSKQGNDPKNSAPSSYNFDALLRSMPSSQHNTTHDKSGSSTPRGTRPDPATKLNSSKGYDAFSSLLPSSFQEESITGSGTQSTLQNGSGVKLAGTNTNPPKPKSTSTVTNGTTSRDTQNTMADIWKFDAFEQHASQKKPSRSKAPSPSTANNWDWLQDVSHTNSHSTSSQTRSSNSIATDLLDDSLQGHGTSVPATNASKSSSSVNLLDDFFSSGPAATSSKPSQSSTSAAPEPANPTFSSASQTPLRTHSPPPHVVGKLVEMGFAPKAARQALAQTATGVEIEAALTILTRDQEPHDMHSEIQTGRKEQKSNQTLQNAATKRNEHPRTSMPASTTSSRPNHAQDADWQKQADQFRSQATEIGSSMLKSANAFWGSAKAQAQRALEEARTDHDGSAVDMAAGLGRHAWRRWGSSMQAYRTKPLDYDGRPRWMQDAEQDRGQAQESLDDCHQQVAERSKPETHTAVPAKPFSVSEPEMLSFSDENSLHTAHAPTQVDTVRKKNDMRPKSSTTATSSDSIERNKATMAKSTKGPMNHTGKTAMLQRPMPKEDPSTVERAQKFKAEGNAAFQRGSYAEAEQKYSQALDVLCESSLYRIPLLNNRANVRSKNGDSQGTCSDCTACLAILILPAMQSASGTPIYRPNQEKPLPASYQVNLREAYAKCISQRARAYEVREQWSCALQDWIALQTYERTEGSGSRLGASNRRAASDGLIRCEKMLRPSTSSKPKTANRASNSSKTSAPNLHAAAERASDAGRDRVRKQMQAQDAEDAERLQLKDAVEARLQAWIHGKKGNVRALLSSVDDPQYNLIWPGLQWKKVHLHELLTDAQVKRAYTRAIAKLHPDKLQRDSTSVEQRMLAAGVFHTLNEAFHT